jgi:hypothetical protein
MRYLKPVTLMRAAGFVLVALATLPLPAHAGTCTGTTSLQLRWSAKTGAALLSLAATRCDRPPACSASGERAAGTMFTTSPIAITLKDASGRSQSSTVDAGAANCGARCERTNRGGCMGGADIHRLGSSFVRYVVNTLGQTSVVANKVNVPMAERPNLVTPISVTITDGGGYALTAELRKCRVRQSAAAVVVKCS